MSTLQEPEKLAVVYLRVSSRRQMDTASDIDPEGNSIATQRKVCKAKCAAAGARIIKEFVEPGTSAQTIEKQPVFRQMLAYLAENPSVDYVVIYMRSRAFRNLGDAVLTKRRLERMQMKLLSAKEDFGEGIMADAMEAVTDIINEVQVRMSGEDIRVKMRHKAENGGTLGKAKIGYRNVRIEHEGRQVNSIAVDEERAPFIRQMFKLYATGEYTIERLSDTMADLGLTTRATRRSPKQPVASSQIHRMLSDSYYIGVVTFKGETFPGRHEPIVDQDTFDRVQEVLDARSARGQRDRVHFHYLKGLLFCDRCRLKGRTSRMIFVEARGQAGGKHQYFLCRGRQEKVCDLPHLPIALVEESVARYYNTLQLDDSFATEAARLVNATVADQTSAVRELHKGYEKQLNELDVQEERLIDLATDGAMPTEKIKARLRKIHLERERANAGLNESGEKLAAGAKALTTYLSLLANVADLYETALDKARRQLNEAFFERLYIDLEGITESWLTEPVNEIKDAQVVYLRRSPSVASRLNENETRPHQQMRSRSSSVALLADVWSVGSSKATVVGLTGFEPAASSSRTKRATKLRHSPLPSLTSVATIPESPDGR
jgi:site-specific DNA recombinase